MPINFYLFGKKEKKNVKEIIFKRFNTIQCPCKRFVGLSTIKFILFLFFVDFNFVVAYTTSKTNRQNSLGKKNNRKKREIIINSLTLNNDNKTNNTKLTKIENKIENSL